jgi:nucleoside 2-deoxyribosyltransferase
VALEVGYMLALGKQVCFLKDKTLKGLHADLIGKMYRPFDTQRIDTTVSSGLSKWLKEKGLER